MALRKYIKGNFVLETRHSHNSLELEVPVTNSTQVKPGGKLSSVLHGDSSFHLLTKLSDSFRRQIIRYREIKISCTEMAVKMTW